MRDSRLAHAVAKVNGYTGVLARGRAWVVTWGPDRHHPDPGTISMLDPRTGRLSDPQSRRDTDRRGGGPRSGMGYQLRRQHAHPHPSPRLSVRRPADHGRA